MFACLAGFGEVYDSVGACALYCSMKRIRLGVGMGACNDSAYICRALMCGSACIGAAPHSSYPVDLGCALPEACLVQMGKAISVQSQRSLPCARCWGLSPMNLQVTSRKLPHPPRCYTQLQ